MTKNIGIVKKMAFFLAIVSIVVIGISFILYLKFNAVITEQIIKDQKSSLDNSKIMIERFFKGIDDTLRDITMNKNLANLLKSDTEDALEIINNRNDIEIELSICEDKFIQDANVALFITQNIPFASHLIPWKWDKNLNGKFKRGIYNNNNIVDTDWYKIALANKGNIQSLLGDGGDNILFVTAIQNPYLKLNQYNYTNKNNNEYTSVIVLKLSSNVMEEMVRASSLIENSLIQIYNENNQVMYTYKDGEKKTFQEEQYILSDTQLSNGWAIKAFIPVRYIKSKTSFVKFYIGIMTLLNIVMVSLFTYFISKTVTNPILKLAKIMKYTKIPKELPEDETISQYRKENNEIGILYYSYDRMVKQINVSIEMQKEAEYKALQAQINPHFFYNTLDSINWLALCRGEDHIAEMTSTLSNILRYSIKNPNVLTTIAKEIEHVKGYVFIESIRYDNAFQVEYNLETELNDYKVPKFVFQPLIENAIKHGVMNKREGKIKLITERIEKHIWIRIEDTGVGSDVDKLNNYLRGDIDMLINSDGIGIKNVHERVQAVYGRGYGLEYEINQYGGTTVHIALPMENAIKKYT